MQIDYQRIRKILIIQLRAIGDVVVTTPVLPLLRKYFPAAEIHFLTGPEAAGLLEGLSELNRVRVYPYPASSVLGMLRFIRQLRVHRYDLVIDYQVTPGTALLTRLSGASLRLGWKRRHRNWAFNLKSEANKNKEYVAIQKCRALETIGIREISQETRVFISAGDQNTVREYFRKAGVDTGKLLVNMTPKGKRQARQWFPRKIARLTDMLVEKYQAEVFYNWAPGEKEYVEQTASLVQTKVHILPGWTLKRFAAFLSLIDLHFSYSNGPLHIAKAVGTPTLGLFAADQPELWNPLNNPRHPYIVSTVPCRFCNLQECSLMLCMEEIEPEHVLEKIERIPALREKLNRS